MQPSIIKPAIRQDVQFALASWATYIPDVPEKWYKNSRFLAACIRQLAGHVDDSITQALLNMWKAA